MQLLAVHLTPHDMKRLELYSRNMVDHHMILDLLPTLARLLFAGRFPSVRLSHLQLAVLLAVGLQHRNVDSLGTELDLPVNQVLAFFNKTIRRITAGIRSLLESQAQTQLPARRTLLGMQDKANAMSSLSESLNDDQLSDQRAFSKKIKAQTNLVVSLPKSEAPSTSVGYIKEGDKSVSSSNKDKEKNKKKKLKEKRTEDKESEAGIYHSRSLFSLLEFSCLIYT